MAPEDQKDSEFHALPQRMPIDQLSLTNCSLAFATVLPSTRSLFFPDIKKSLTRNADECLDDKSFLDKYGDGVLSKYNLIESNEGEWIIDDGDDEGGDGNVQEEEIPLLYGRY